MKRWGWAILLAQAAVAATPVITELTPRGAEIGRPFTLTLAGRNLVDGARITSTMPATFTPVIPSPKPGMMMMGAGRSVSFLVEPKADAQPGVYSVRLETPSGISNILLFTLGTFPELTETESQPYSQPNSNDSIETAEPLPAGQIVVNGTLRGPERDVYRIAAKASERRVFEVESRRSGSAVDPVVRILDGAGKQLARSDDSPGVGLDTRLDFTFPKDGNYYVEVTDARFSNQAQNFYRLKMGSYRYADGIFPLGGKRGEQVAVTFYGGRVGSAAATADLRHVAKTSGVTTVSLADSPTLPFAFAVSDLPEAMEPLAGPAAVPGVINGRIEKPGEIDRYRFQVEPGEKLLLEMQARELGTSKLEAILTVYDGAGKRLDSAGDKPLPEDVFAIQGTSRTSNDPFLNVTVPEGVHELAVTVEDLALRGGPSYGYRLIARKQAEDFTLTIQTPFVDIPAGGSAIISVSADRRGYDGPIQLTIPNLPAGIKAEGGIIPREYVDANNSRTFNRRGILILTADPGVEMKTPQLEVWGEGAAGDGNTLRRQARGLGVVTGVTGATEQGVVDRQRSLTAPWLGLELPVALGDPTPATLEVRETAAKEMAEGVRYEYAYEWKVRGRGTPPAQIGADVIGAKDLRIIDMKSEKGNLTGTFAVTTTKATDPGRYDLYCNGRIRTDDGEETVISRPLPFVVGGAKSGSR